MKYDLRLSPPKSNSEVIFDTVEAVSAEKALDYVSQISAGAHPQLRREIDFRFGATEFDPAADIATRECDDWIITAEPEFLG